MKSNVGSEKQIRASRENGAHSRGPIIPAGKPMSARNRISHPAAPASSTWREIGITERTQEAVENNEEQP